MGTPYTKRNRRRGSGLRDSDSDDDLEYECRKFRICIIGRAGVGKSTLLGKVFGMTDEQAHVRTREQALHYGGGVHNIWDEITDENRNRSLIIHDSRGFEASETDSIQTVKQFVSQRSNRNSLSEQLHCIWYCLSLAEDRPLHNQERALFQFFRDRDIPLVFVLTKYDKLIKEKLDGLAQDDENPTTREWAQAKQQARQYVDNFRWELQQSAGQVAKVQEISHKERDNPLIQQLVAVTAEVVRPKLRNLWIRAQGVLATQKRDACILEFPRKTMRSLITHCSIPLSVLKPIALDDFFERVFVHCMTIWNLPGQSSLFTKDFIKRQFREATQRYLSQADIAATFDILGPVTAPLYIKLAIKITCDMIMIFQQLFWATPRRYILTRQDLEQQLNAFRGSEIRKTIHTLVDGNMAGLDYITSYRIDSILNTIKEVVNSGQRLVADKLHTEQNVDVDEISLPELPA